MPADTPDTQRQPPMTPAERQQKRRDKLKQDRQASQKNSGEYLPLRTTRQDLWDESTGTILVLIEEYRAWRSWNPAPAETPPVHQLPRLAAMALSLAMTKFPDNFAWTWYCPEISEPIETLSPDADPRPLREQLLSARPMSFDADHFPRTPEGDQKAREWWDRLPAEWRPSWLSIAGTEDPVEAWYIAFDADEKRAAIKRLPPHGLAPRRKLP